MILVKEEIKYIFDPRFLLPGDILLMNTYEEKLRERMGCAYEHAAIYIGDAQIMEANGAHVKMSHLYSYAFREFDHACALRLKKFNPRIAELVARNSRIQMGREYVDTMQFRHVRAYKNSEEQDKSNRSFCSRLVAQSYAQEGIHLLPNSDYCEPDDFLKSDLLEPVKKAIMYINEDLLPVVISQQRLREECEIESPNAELFKRLSELYQEDIQDLTQALSPSFRRPELNEDAIEIIKASKMFKHMELVKNTSPWIMNDEEFLDHYKCIDDALHFIYSNLQHYDHTIIPDYRELQLQMVRLAYYYPKNTLFIFMKDYITKMVDEAITCRKRFAELFYLVAKMRSSETLSFIERYGVYQDVDYTPTTLDISFLLNDVFKSLEKRKK